MQCDNSALPDAPLALACSGLNFSYEVTPPTPNPRVLYQLRI